MSEPIAIVPPRVAFLDPRTGDISRQWYLLILAIVNRLGGVAGLSNDDLAQGTLTGNTTTNLESLLQQINDALNSEPVSASYGSQALEDNVQPAVPDFSHQDDVTPTYSFGTLADQNANRVAITGGAVDATSIGATTASTGKFSTLAVVGNVGFYNTAPVVKATVVGSRAGNAALASLLTALAGYGLVTDTTTV